MPDRQKSTPPPVPPVTPGEEDAQSDLRRVLELLWFVEHFLDLAYSRLPDPADAEAMGNGEIPESLAFSLRGSIECAQTDHVDPLGDLLRQAVAETPGSLVRDWQKRHRKGRR
jgi:hypothetical protein